MQRGYQDTWAAGLILGAGLSCQSMIHDPPLPSSATLPAALPRRLGCTLHSTTYSFSIMFPNCPVYEKWQAFHFIQNMRNLNKHRFPSHVSIDLLLKVVLHSVSGDSDTVQNDGPLHASLCIREPSAQWIPKKRDAS